MRFPSSPLGLERCERRGAPQRKPLRPGEFLDEQIIDNEALAHQIYAGADIFLMPSRYEPCGLGQMYALKYGTIPLVRAVGGLKDTVAEFDPKTGRGNGFLFGPYEASAMLKALDRALALFHEDAAWATLMPWLAASLSYLMVSGDRSFISPPR